jgi:hypothetical protein
MFSWGIETAENVIFRDYVQGYEMIWKFICKLCLLFFRLLADDPTNAGL